MPKAAILKVVPPLSRVMCVVLYSTYPALPGSQGAERNYFPPAQDVGPSRFHTTVIRGPRKGLLNVLRPSLLKGKVGAGGSESSFLSQVEGERRRVAILRTLTQGACWRLQVLKSDTPAGTRALHLVEVYAYLLGLLADCACRLWLLVAAS